jgi:hypothetical protein
LASGKHHIGAAISIRTNRRATRSVYLNAMTDGRRRTTDPGPNTPLVQPQELAMLKSSVLFAIAASTTVGLAALAPTAASARPVGGFHVARVVGPGHFVGRVGVYRYGGVFYNRRFFVGYRAPFVAWRPGFCWRHPWYCRARFGAYRVAPVIPAAPVVAPVVAPFRRCLTERRLADGTSLFRNWCTNEAAISGGAAEPPLSPLPPVK